MEPRSEPDGGLWQLLALVFAPEIRAWRGDARLWVVFWIYGVGVSSILILLYATTVLQGQLAGQQGMLILGGFYTLWILVAIWRCALAQETIWSQFARFLTIAWALNAALVLLFRQLELMMLVFGAGGG